MFIRVIFSLSKFNEHYKFFFYSVVDCLLPKVTVSSHRLVGF